MSGFSTPDRHTIIKTVVSLAKTVMFAPVLGTPVWASVVVAGLWGAPSGAVLGSETSKDILDGENYTDFPGRHGRR
ncbi:hypothetical protein [Labrenzia sp. THAF82]|uniref:hypothetical protein n=1 Tax=Labrenzia sp. THAF82 TaxID=2587861 RepID=UPI0015630804|nr:hypothetical protein [Labrenzia sp. THAF82]